MKRWFMCCAAVIVWVCAGCGSSQDRKGPDKVSPDVLAGYIEDGSTAQDAAARILVVDTRSSGDYIEGHIKDALNVPYDLISEDDKPLYTDGTSDVSTTASTDLKDSWLAHLLVNQLVNDFSSTYADSGIVFYGEKGCKAARLAADVGYSNVSCLDMDAESWFADNPELVEYYGPGVVSVDETAGSVVFSGFVNTTNYANVSTRATHHGITYKGGCLSTYSFLQADLPPFCFQELMTYLGANPDGNMAEGIVFGDMSDWQGKFPDGQRILFEITWDGAGRYYTLDEIYEEKASEFDTTPGDFRVVGIMPRIGGTRDSNLNWNPGCIFCFYACVCGITSNANANENTWFDDGGTYDFTTHEENYYAGRFYPRSNLKIGSGDKVYIRATIVDDADI